MLVFYVTTKIYIEQDKCFHILNGDTAYKIAI